MDWISPWINVTERCNCRCSYCYVEKTSRDMQPQTYHALNDYVLGVLRSHRIQTCGYRIGGGEPGLVITQWFRFVEEFLTEADRRGKVEVLTNFVHYDPLFDALMRFDRFLVNVSLDSVTRSKPLPDGTSTAVQVMANIAEFRERHSNPPMHIMTVVTDDGEHLPDLAEYVCEHGFRWYVQFDKTKTVGNAEQLLCNIRYALAVFDRYPSQSIQELGINGFGSWGMKSDCLNGRQMFSVGVDGTVTNCQMQSEVLCTVYDDIVGVLESNTTCKQPCSCCTSCVVYNNCRGNCPRLEHDPVFCYVMKSYMLEAYKVMLKEVEDA